MIPILWKNVNLSMYESAKSYTANEIQKPHVKRWIRQEMSLNTWNLNSNDTRHMHRMAY